MLFNAGNHVPDIPLVEVVGKADNAPPKQIGAIAVNVGALLGLTIILIVAIFAQNPVVGVKV